jgi:AraC-like DNA-binding protein
MTAVSVQEQQTGLARQALIALGLASGPLVALGFTRFAYALLLPPMHQDLHWSYAQAGSMNTANALGYILGAATAAYTDAPRSATLQPVLDAVVLDPAGDHGLEAMAARVGLSVRQLTRSFRRETGTTPARYVERARVEHAKNLLETGDQPLDVVARRSGFGSPETLRRAFLRELGVPPATYRARFRTTGATSMLK